jgi:hypothetical protein
MFRLLDEYVVRPHDRALFEVLANADAASPRPGAEFSKAGREAAGSAPSPTP